MNEQQQANEGKARHIMTMLREADAFTIDNGALLTSLDLNDLKGDATNEVLVARETDAEGQTFESILTEESLWGADVLSDGTIVCKDAENFSVGVKCFTLTPIEYPVGDPDSDFGPEGLEEILKGLAEHEGDIFYDARDHNDAPAEAAIDRLHWATNQAALLIRAIQKLPRAIQGQIFKEAKDSKDFDLAFPDEPKQHKPSQG